MRRVILAVAVVTAVISTVMTTPASATYIGREGKIAFVRANQIYSVAKSGRTVTQLTTVGKNYRPKWSPDGKHIAYIQEDVNGNKNVFEMTATGTRKTQVTSSGTVAAAATWSPDGKTLAFAQTVDNGACAPHVCLETNLFTVKATAPFGSPTQMLGYYTASGQCGDEDHSLRHPIAVDRFVAWSPDGTRIALLNHYDCQLDDVIYMYTPATGEARQYLASGCDCGGYDDWTDLTWGPTVQFGYGHVDQGCCRDPLDFVEKLVYPGFAATLGDKSPAPSPLNTHMAFVNASSGTPNIYTATITGAQRKLVVTNGYQPDWQPLP